MLKSKIGNFLTLDDPTVKVQESSGFLVHTTWDTYLSLARTQREESSGASLVIWPSVFVEGACVTAWIVYC